jgi:hypothetical protein
MIVGPNQSAGVPEPWRINTYYDPLSKNHHLSIASPDVGGMRLVSPPNTPMEIQLYTGDGTKYLTIGPAGFSDGTTTIDIGDAAARFSTWVLMTCSKVAG